MKTAPATHFLKMLNRLMARDTVGAQQHLREMWEGCLEAGADGWESYVQEQILLGRHNLFAQACEREALGCDPAKMERLRRAACYDLGVLQELAVDEGQMIRWCVNGASQPSELEDWAASAAILTEPDNLRIRGSNGAKSPVARLNGDPPAALLPPLSDLDRRALQASIFAQDSWPAATDAVGRYYMHYGIGNVSRSLELRWNGSGLANPLAPGGMLAWPSQAGEHGQEPAQLAAVRAALAQAPSEARLQERVVLVPAEQTVRGESPGGDGPTAQALRGWAEVLGLSSDMGCRLVHAGADQAGQLGDLMRTLGARKRCWFVVGIRGAPTRNASLDQVLAAFAAGVDGMVLPENVIIVASQPIRD